MKAIKIILSTVLMGLVIYSCESITYKELEAKSNTVPVAQDPTYTADAAPIFTDNCTNCHSVANGQSPYLDTFEDVKSACLTGNVLCRIDESCGSIMPQGGKMPQSKIDMIKLWASKGYKQ